MKIGDNAFVALSYDLIVEGEIVDKATAEKPLEFIYDAGFLLPSFEENIKDLKAGDSFAFTLKAADAYGEIMPEAVVELPKSVFMVDGAIEEGMLELGNQIPMMDNQGNQMIGKVVGVTDEMVKMDFNHPLAGKTLNFAGKIESVREVTDVDRAKFMGMGGGCGCGDSACSEGCDCSDTDAKDAGGGCGCS